MKTLFLNLPALFFACSLFLSSCGGAGKNPKDEAMLAEARKIHSEAFKLHKDVMKDLAELKKSKAALQDSLKKFLEKADIAAEKAKELPLQKQLDAIGEQEKAMSEWMNNVQEVAGEEGHEGHEGHDHEGHEGHDHKPAPKVSATDMLAYQKEMLKNIQKLQQDVKALSKK